MSVLVEIAPAIPMIFGAGLIGWFVVKSFRLIKHRPRLSDVYRNPGEPTKWLALDGHDVPPVRPALPVVYTGTARPRLPKGEPVEAEILQSDELTRKLARS